MPATLTRHMHLAIYLLIAGLILFVNYCLLHDRSDLLQLSLITSALAFLSFFLLFRKEYLIHLLILSIPFSVQTGIGGSGAAVSLPAEPLVAFLVLLFVWKACTEDFLDRKILTHPLTIILMVDLAWLCIAAIFSSDVIVSLKRVVVRAGFILVFYLLFAHWFQDRKNIPKLFFFYALALFFIIAWVIKNHAHYDFTVQTSFMITQPFYSDHTVYGTTLAFLLPMFVVLSLRAKTFGFPVFFKSLLFALTILMLVAEVLSFSRAAMLSLAVAFSFYILIYFKMQMRGLLLLLAAISIIVAVSFNSIYTTVKENEAVSNNPDYVEHLQSVTNISTDNSNLERINRWICAIRMFKEKPFVGFGPGTYQFEYGKYQSRAEMTYLSTFHGDKGNAHSEYLTYLSETGLPGMIIFLLVALITIATAFRVIYTTSDRQVKYLAIGLLMGLIGYFFHGFFNSFIDQDKIAILVFGSMAALTALDCPIRKQQNVNA